MKIQTHLKIFNGQYNFVPLIDVVFLLLIFFMLSSSFVTVSAIDITLPNVKAQTTSAEKLVITISKDNKLYFNDQLMGLQTLKEQLGRVTAQNKIDSVIIRADKDTPHGAVAKILALANSLNLNVYFAVSSSDNTSQVPFETQS